MADGALSPDDLGVLDPTPGRVTLSGGLVVDVTPITVRQLVPFVRALGPAREALANPGADLWDLIADYGDDITEALAVALAMPLGAVQCLSPGDYLGCLNAVMEANRDFFASWLLAPAMAMAARNQEPAEGGPTSFSNLSVPGTD